MKRTFQSVRVWQDIWKRAVLAIALLSTVVASSVAGAVPVQAQTLDGSWSCTIPSGYVHSAIQRDTSCANGIRYRLAWPSEGKWVCQVPKPWAYDTLSSSTLYGPCQLGASWGRSLRLAKPAAGRIVCELPKNNIWTYYGVSRNTSSTECRLGGGITGIQLAVPASGQWACHVPAGFTYTQTYNFSGSGSSPCLGTYAYLLKKL